MFSWSISSDIRDGQLKFHSTASDNAYWTEAPKNHLGVENNDTYVQKRIEYNNWLYLKINIRDELPLLVPIFVSPERSSERDYVITDSVCSM